MVQPTMFNFDPDEKELEVDKDLIKIENGISMQSVLATINGLME